MSDNLGYVTYRKQRGRPYPPNLTEGKAYKVQEYFDAHKNVGAHLRLGSKYKIAIKDDNGRAFCADAWKFEKVGETS